jgi:hypothetical protein
MSLEEDLKARTLALISSQMANWVVEIQRHIQDHQATLVQKLDELGETVARYDEKIDEGAIGVAMAEVVATQPPAAPIGPGFDRLKSSLAAIERGTSLSEVLTYLVNEVGTYVERGAMFIVKGPSAIGWYSRGVTPGDLVKQVNISLAADTVFKSVQASRQPVRLPLAQSPATAQALAKLGGNPQYAIAVPLILRDKLAAILYCDSSKGAIPEGDADLIEILTSVAGKIIDVLSVAPKPAPGARTSGGTTQERAAAIKADTDATRERAGVVAPAPAPRPAAHTPAHDEGGATVMVRAQPAPAPAPAPAPRPAASTVPPAGQDEGSSTVMFNASQFQAMRPQAPAVTPKPAPAPAPAPPPAAPAAPAIPPEQQKAHDDAKRFARLVVSEIKLYNEAKVAEGRRNRDLYERLKEDIERGRQMYSERVQPQVRDSTNYFFDELVRILAGGDSGALGPM